MSKIKVLMFCPTPPPFAGPEVSSELLLKYLPQGKINIIHLRSNLRKENWQKGILDINGVYKFLILYFKFLYCLIIKSPAKVYLLLSSSKIGFLRDSVIIFTSKFFNKKVIAHYRGGNFHNFYNKQNNKYQEYIKKTLSNVDLIIVQAEILKGIFINIFDIKKLKVLYNGIEISNDISSKNFSQKEITLLFIGHIAYSKGFYHLIEAYKEIYKELNLRFLFAGTLRYKGYKSETQKEFLYGEGLVFYEKNDKKITEAIDEFVNNPEKYNAEYLGVINENQKKEIFSNSDIFILPSFTEGFSVSVLEAMKNGLPVLTTKVGALPEIISDGINGFYIGELNKENIIETIQKIYNNKIILSDISSFNIGYVRNNFDIKKISAKFSAILAEE